MYALLYEKCFPCIGLSKTRKDAGADPSQHDQHAEVASLGHHEARRDMDFDKMYHNRTQEMKE